MSWWQPSFEDTCAAHVTLRMQYALVHAAAAAWTRRLLAGGERRVDQGLYNSSVSASAQAFRCKHNLAT